MQHPEEVLGESLVAHDEPPKVLEPGKQSLDLPSPSVATQRATPIPQPCSDVSMKGFIVRRTGP